MANNNSQILVMTEVHTKGDAPPPPPTDMFFSDRAQLRTGLVDALRFGVAVGLGAALLFLIIAVVAALSGASAALSFFEAVYPGFTTGTVEAFFFGFAWTFLYGLIFGVITGVVYNSLFNQAVAASVSNDIFG